MPQNLSRGLPSVSTTIAPGEKGAVLLREAKLLPCPGSLFSMERLSLRGPSVGKEPGVRLHADSCEVPNKGAW